MKKLVFLFLFGLSLSAQAQSEKFNNAMKTNLALFDSAKTSLDFQGIANSFERIAAAEKNQWLPYYYAGLAWSRIYWIDPTVDKEGNADKIKSDCDKAEALEKNAEIMALRNIYETQLMLIDPQNRWQTNGAKASQYLQEGMKLDPNNPRLYYLQAMNLYGTPEAFGGGKAVAKPIFEKALALYKTFNVKPLYPNWGEKESANMLAKCQ